ncbi:MAG: STT3 domain-containing protein [Candidatus Hodarchaeota archaeon]
MVSLQTKIKRFFQEGVEKSKANLKISPKNILLALSLILVFTCAVFIRLAPLFNNVYMIKAFDPWVQYKATLFMVNNGPWEYLDWVDYQSWYPEGTKFYNLYIGLPLTNSIFYWILSGLGFPVTIYDVCFVSPAFMGGLTCIAMYFLGKEVLDKKTGLIAAFFMAFSPGYMQRTVAGFYDNETIGVFATVLCLLFFIRSLKKGSVIDGLLGGLSFGYLSLSWGGYIYTSMLIPLFAVLLIAFKKYSHRLLIAYSSMMGPGLIIHSFYRRDTIDLFFSSSGLLIPLAVLILLPFVEFLYRKKQYDQSWYRGFWKLIKKAIIPVCIIAAVSLWIMVEFFDVDIISLQSRFMTILNPVYRNQVAIVASVGEHMPAPWSVFYYNTFIPILFVIPGVYFAYKRGNEVDVVAIIFTLTLFYFTGSMIRIILLFAPAVSLMGSYGISQILKSFGTVSQKKRTIVRRRRRDARQMLDRSAGVVVFIMFGFLFTAQVFHASDIAKKQLPWSEIISGGQFHDWEETFSWMRAQLDTGTVVVSWWDYGYWSTVLGNVTTVNDNGTYNQSKIGLTGMAMMMNDELESARALKHLGAEYVLVYFGHMVSGLGGDEGKWPWMVKICNDNSHHYTNSEVYPTLTTGPDGPWYKPGEQVFNYATTETDPGYINESNGLYDTHWFFSPLVRMMFHDEPLAYNEITTQEPLLQQLQQWTIREILGDGTDAKPARKATNGTEWSKIMSTSAFKDFKVFKKAFYSTHHMVKIFKVDYTPIESDFVINNAQLYDNSYGWVNITNTGMHTINLSTVQTIFGGGSFLSQASPVSAFEGLNNVEPGEDKLFWFKLENVLINSSQEWPLRLTAEVKGEDSIFDIKRTSEDILVIEVENMSINIDRMNSGGKVPGIVEVCVENTGNESVKVNKIYVDDVEFGLDDIIPLNDTNVVPVNESRYFQVNDDSATHQVGDFVTVNVTTFEGITDATTVTFNEGDSRLTINTDYITLPESDLVFNDDFVKNYSLINFSDPLMTRTRSFIPVDLQKNYASTNGSIKFEIQNTGSSLLGIDTLTINGSLFSGWSVNDSHFFGPGETRTISVSKSSLQLEAVQDIKIQAIDEYGSPVAADRGLIKTIYDGKAIKILDQNYRTFAFTNETIDVMIKNVGNQAINVTSLNATVIGNFTVNSTSIDESMIVLGENDSTILDISESFVIRYNFSDLGIVNYNATDSIDLGVETDTVNVNDTAIVNATINPMVNMSISLRDELNASGQVKLLVSNNGISDTHLNFTVDVIRLEIEKSGTIYTEWFRNSTYQPDGGFSIPQVTLQSSETPSVQWSGNSSYYVQTGDIMEITVYTSDGGEDKIIEIVT